jgi:hypothetical protein
VEPGDDTPLGAEIADQADAMLRRMRASTSRPRPRRRALPRLLVGVSVIRRRQRAPGTSSAQGDRVALLPLRRRKAAAHHRQKLRRRAARRHGSHFTCGATRPACRSAPASAEAITRAWIYTGFTGIDGQSFIETYSHPYVYAELPMNIKEGTPEFQRVVTALRNLMVDQRGIISPGVELKFLESASKAATVKDVFIAWMDDVEVGHLPRTLGVELTTEAGSNGLGHGRDAQGARRRRAGSDRGAGRQRRGRHQPADAAAVDHLQLGSHGAGAAGVPSQVGKPVDKKSEAETRKTDAEALKIVGPVIKTFSRSQLRSASTSTIRRSE